MRGHSYSSLLRASGGEGGDDRQVRQCSQLSAAAAASQRQLPAAQADARSPARREPLLLSSCL